MAGGVHHQLAAFQRLGVERLSHFRGLALVDNAGTAQHGLDALQQEALREGLVHVVVGAEVEPQDFVDLVVLRGQDDDRQVGIGAHPLQHFHAVHARHLDVEDGKVGRILLQCRQAGGAVEIGLDGMAAAFERQGYAGHYVFVVVDQGDFGHGVSSLGKAKVPPDACQIIIYVHIILPAFVSWRQRGDSAVIFGRI